MPHATTSRRKLATRRQNSEDIEDIRNTQLNGKKDDVSDEDRPRAARNAKKEKKANGKQKQRAEPEDQDEDAVAVDDEEDDEDDRIDVSNLPDEPLRRSDMHKLNGMTEDWRNMRAQIGQRGDIYKDVAAAMAEAGEESVETSEDLQEIDAAMKDFLDVDAEMEAHATTLDEIYQQLARGERIDKPVERYDNGLEERKNNYAGKTTRQKYARDERYKLFRSSIWDVRHPDDPMPPITEFIPKEDGDDDDDDDELETGGVTQNYKCPITLTLLINPVTSKVCGHSFSADAIKAHCRPVSAQHKCPAAGCNKSFKLSDCISDAKLDKKVKDYKRRQAANARDDDSDAEEVVD
ncbi:hypothetical protein CPB84DRAFT_1766349 [Gymnopilus junonius]|uniref:SP-RING-type domain-containing protein n=1 Tax=Gymnopilus junonius TaxID=109634 RepID=A0A9P5NZ71_GYMJU|nr:hypothetical protein CPB84DRAFT_1766349 [Gymnopilus junonius]